MSLCKKCNSKLVTVSGFISEFQADQEPYEGGKLELHDGIDSEVYLTGEFCEKCDLFMSLEIDQDSSCIFQPPNKVDSIDTKPRCEKCKDWNDKSILANYCYNCGRALSD